ncbi:Arm DNA-binding domain-containing protein, partial [Aeromonas salmonicida]
MSDLPSRFRFTQKAIEALPPNPANAKSTEAEYSDTQISGLKCLVGKGEGNKKFLMRYLWHGRKRAIAIGRFPDVDGVVAQISQQIMISPAPSDRYTRGFLTGRP